MMGFNQLRIKFTAKLREWPEGNRDVPAMRFNNKTLTWRQLKEEYEWRNNIAGLELLCRSHHLKLHRGNGGAAMAQLGATEIIEEGSGS
jgi:hypothetical protein